MKNCLRAKEDFEKKIYGDRFEDNIQKVGFQVASVLVSKYISNGAIYQGKICARIPPAEKRANLLIICQALIDDNLDRFVKDADYVKPEYLASESFDLTKFPVNKSSAKYQEAGSPNRKKELDSPNLASESFNKSSAQYQDAGSPDKKKESNSPSSKKNSSSSPDKVKASPKKLFACFRK